MITEPILNFVVVVCVQLLFLLVYAAAVGAIKSVPKLLVWGIVIGLPFGLVIDLVWGKWVGVFTYQLGFVPWFLLLNGLFSYGVWMANVLLLRKSNFGQVYCMSVLLAVVYETTNYYFPVWEWTFSTPLVEYVVVIFVCYTSLTCCTVYLLRSLEARFIR